MFNKAFVFVALVCFIQATRGDDISDLIKELAPKIKEATVKVANLTVNVGRQVHEASQQIQQDMNVYDKDLVPAKIKLFKIVYQAIVDAKESGKDISSCLNDFILAFNDLIGWGFEACRLSQDLNDILEDLAQLAKSELALLASPVKCTVSSGGDLEKLKQCVLDAIDVVNTQADEIEAEVEPKVTAALDNAKKCGSERAPVLADLIQTTTDNFNDCISKA